MKCDKDAQHRERGQQGQAAERRLQMDSGSRQWETMIAPHPKGISKSAHTENCCSALGDIPELGSPFLDPFGALLAGHK
jgi:hypothetical protein